MKKFTYGFFLGLFITIATIFFLKKDFLLQDNRLKNYIIKTLKSPLNTKSLSYHLRESTKNLVNPTEFEKVAAINDYLYQYFVLKNHIGRSPEEILKHKQGLCDAHAYCMTEMLRNAGIKCQQAHLYGIPLMSTHEMVQVYFCNGEVGLFDPTFGTYWKSPQSKKLLSIEELIQNPKLANQCLQKTKHTKNKSKSHPLQPFINSDKHYKSMPKFTFYETLYTYEKLLNEMKGGGVYTNSQKQFIFLTLPSSPVVIGDKNDAQRLVCYKNSDNHPISRLRNIGTTEEVNWSHIYKFTNLDPHKTYVLTLHYSDSRDTTLAVLLTNGTINGQKSCSTHHINIENSRSANSLNLFIVPEKSEALLILDNPKGLINLMEIEFQAFDEGFSEYAFLRSKSG